MPWCRGASASRTAQFSHGSVRSPLQSESRPSLRCIVGILRVRDFSTATEVGILIGRLGVDPSAWSRGSGQPTTWIRGRVSDTCAKCSSFLPGFLRYPMLSQTLSFTFFDCFDSTKSGLFRFLLNNFLSHLSHFSFKRCLHFCPYFSTFSEATMQSWRCCWHFTLHIWRVCAS